MKIKKRYLLFIVIGLILSMFVAYKRITIENKYKNYDVTMELNDIKIMASYKGKDYIDMAKEFMDIGINSVTVNEKTLSSMEISDKYKINVSYDGYNLKITGPKSSLEYIKNGFETTLIEKRKMTYLDDNTLVIEGKLSDFVYDQSRILRDFSERRVGVEKYKVSLLEYVGLGYDVEDLEQLRKNNIPFSLRPTYITQLQDGVKSIDRFFDYIDKYNKNQSFVVFSGYSILGGKDQVQYLADNLKQRHIVPSAIETPEQNGNMQMDGMPELAKAMDYSMTRLFSTLSYIQSRYDYGIAGHHQGQEIINCYYRAISERNIRLIYFRVFHYKEGDLITDMQIYKQRLSELKTRLDKFYSIVPVENGQKLDTMTDLQTSPYIKMIAGFAVIAATFMLIDNIFPNTDKLQNILFPISILGTTAIYTLKISMDKVSIMLALLDTIVFASLSIMYLIYKLKQNTTGQTRQLSNIKLFFAGVIQLLKCILISFAGALLLVTFYADSVYMLEFSKFSGVKISQMMPLIISVFSYLSIVGLVDYIQSDLSMKEQLKIILKQNIKIWQAALVFVMLGVVTLMILRSGHTSDIEPSSSEILMRNIFEYIFPARPRNKAIFLGYPALIMVIILSLKKRYKISYLIFILAATIGQSDILNTFSHIRTPFLLSVERVLVEIFVALIITAVIFIIYTLFEKKVLKRTNIYE